MHIAPSRISLHPVSLASLSDFRLLRAASRRTMSWPALSFQSPRAAFVRFCSLFASSPIFASIDLSRFFSFVRKASRAGPTESAISSTAPSTVRLMSSVADFSGVSSCVDSLHPKILARIRHIKPGPENPLSFGLLIMLAVLHEILKAHEFWSEVSSRCRDNHFKACLIQIRPGVRGDLLRKPRGH